MTVRCTMLLFAVAASISRVAAGDLILADNGQTDYRIVVADNASLSTQYAASELQAFLRQITGAELPIVSDQEPATDHEVVLGKSARLRDITPAISFDALGDEGYVLRTTGSRLVIAGGERRGNLYGVYGLLEDHFGCRWFTPTVSRIPTKARLVVPDLDERQVPKLEYREPFTYECFDGDWCARNRVNSSEARLEARHGGKVTFGDGFFVHTFERLVPPDKYFDEHPEYFSLVNGARKKERSQLCCTNEAVVRLCIEGIRSAMREQPNAFAFSISQNDWYDYCECDNCQTLAQKKGSQMAPVLQLVNRVAAAVAEDFPDQVVETLAYQWTRKAPRTIRPLPNVVVRLCSIECCFAHSLADCESEANVRFREDAKEWAQIANRLWVWDYTTDFRHYLLPFPNQRIRNDNIKFFIEHNVTGIFEQDTYNTPHSELAELGGYLTAKFLWNPDYDEDAAIDEFLDAYYEEAAVPIRKYIDLIHDKVEAEGIHVGIWADPESAHLADDLLLEANLLWQQAELAVALNPEVLRRVELSRMSVDYAILERVRRRVTKQLPSGDARLHAVALLRLEPFLTTLRSSDLSRIEEWTAVDKKAYSRELTEVIRPSDR